MSPEAWESRVIQTTASNPFGMSLTADSYSFSSGYAQWVDPERQITHILRESFRQVPQVESICAQFNQDGIIIWTLLDSYDRSAREKVYEKELEICSELRICDFDFRVTSIELVSPAELTKGGFIELFRRR